MKYRPSNGSEGMWFESEFCAQCINEKYMHTLNDDDKKCDIYNRAILFNVDEPEYPIEWIKDGDSGRCTAFVKWDWDKGDPDDPENYVPPISPNQLVLPFFSEQVEKILTIKELIET